MQFGQQWFWRRQRGGGDPERLLRLDFVKATRLAGHGGRRWRIETRTRPVGAWKEDHHTEGTLEEIEKHARLLNAELAQQHQEYQQRKQERRERRETGRANQSQQQQRRHNEAVEDQKPGHIGGHLPGDIRKCPVCREAMWKGQDRLRDPKEDD